MTRLLNRVAELVASVMKLLSENATLLHRAVGAEEVVRERENLNTDASAALVVTNEPLKIILKKQVLKTHAKGSHPRTLIRVHSGQQFIEKFRHVRVSART